MIFATLIMAIVALVLFAIATKQGIDTKPSFGFSVQTVLGILPLLFFAFLVAGLIQAILPPEKVSLWVGQESGWRGIWIGTLAGALAPGGPFVSFPLVAAMMKLNVSVGTMIAFISSWSLLGLSRIPLEFGIVGWKFVFIRLACTFFFPPLAGFIAQTFFHNIKWS